MRALYCQRPPFIWYTPRTRTSERTAIGTHQKAYRYRLLPTPQQEEVFRRWAGARRWVYNHALARRIAHYNATGASLTVAQLCAELTILKRQPETAWLRDCNAQSLQQAIRDLDRAFGAFFARRSRFPRFRSKKRDRPSFRLPAEVRLEGNRLYVPKMVSFGSSSTDRLRVSSRVRPSRKTRPVRGTSAS